MPVVAWNCSEKQGNVHIRQSFTERGGVVLTKTVVNNSSKDVYLIARIDPNLGADYDDRTEECVLPSGKTAAINWDEGQRLRGIGISFYDEEKDVMPGEGSIVKEVYSSKEGDAADKLLNDSGVLSISEQGSSVNISSS